MEIKQISVFLENTTGRISEVTRTLANAGINLRAISIADTADFGILRLIAVEIDDVPGSLARLMELFQKSQVNIEYLYSSLEGKAGKAVVIFKLEDHDKGFAILKDNGLTMAERF